VTGIVDVPGVEVFGKGRGEYEVPCGYVDPQGKVHKKVRLRELTGAEEDMMDDDSVPSPQRMTDVLAACTEQIGDIEDKAQIKAIIGDSLQAGLPLTSSDRIAMMIFLRRCSVGDTYHFERRCPRCGHVNQNKSLDLRALEIKQVPEDRVPKRRVQVTLPRSGKKAVVRVLTAKHESKLTDLRPDQKDLRSAAIAARLESVAEHTFMHPTETIQAVKALPLDDRNYLRKVYNLVEADVDTMCEVQCNSKICNAEFRFALDLGQTFFSNPVAEQVSDADLNWL
jgi:hypothetical protein